MPEGSNKLISELRPWNPLNYRETTGSPEEFGLSPRPVSPFGLNSRIKTSNFNWEISPRLKTRSMRARPADPAYLR